jgi:hypothetical protein
MISGDSFARGNLASRIWLIEVRGDTCVGNRLRESLGRIFEAMLLRVGLDEIEDRFAAPSSLLKR